MDILDKTFRFKIIDTMHYVNKNGKDVYKAILFCYFGFNVDVFLSYDKYMQLNELALTSDFNINDYISVYYDKVNNKFAYFINF